MMMHSALTASAESRSPCYKRRNQKTPFLFMFLTLSYTIIRKSQIVESKPINFASPLKCLTIRDSKTDEPPSPRSNFIARFKSGIESERRVRKEILEEAKNVVNLKLIIQQENLMLIKMKISSKVPNGPK